VSLLRTSAIRLLRSVRVSVSIASRPADGIARRCTPTACSKLPCGKSTSLKPAGQGKYSLFHRHSYAWAMARSLPLVPHSWSLLPWF